MAQQIKSAAKWADLRLPAEVVAKLKEICGEVKESRKANPGTGLTILFSGPSGTEKSKAAEVIANELRLDLCPMDLAGIVNKGQTEKNLQRAFDGAATTRTIVIFDEGKSLFDKRSEVKSTDDRSANFEVG